MSLLPRSLRSRSACTRCLFGHASPSSHGLPRASFGPESRIRSITSSARRSIPISASSASSSEPLVSETIIEDSQGEVGASSSKSSAAAAEGEAAGGNEVRTVGEQKINTWFLDPSFSPSASSKSASEHIASSSSSSSFSSSNLNSNGQFRQPIFTSYNASTTSPSASPVASPPPLPSNTPSQLFSIHSFMTSPQSEAADVIQLATVQMFDTTLLNEYLERRGEGSMLDDVDGRERGGNWDWVITAVVKGRGRGVVARADGVVRRWLLKHPLSPSIEPTKLAYPKTPRISPDSDWSIIPLDLGSHAESGGVRACVNLLSEEGSDRWRLEDLWNARG
ncbi:hypothetical protein I317_03719 [Kwoniella heveanensis CBS 569]|nr:hypothetical protein I317_03719 [Kwoniella heveanensis CBS 569]